MALAHNENQATQENGHFFPTIFGPGTPSFRNHFRLFDKRYLQSSTRPAQKIILVETQLRGVTRARVRVTPSDSK